jgi:hypothetical protein
MNSRMSMAVAMSNVRSIESGRTATGSASEYREGYDAGYANGLRVGTEQKIVSGFWYGVATCAVIAVVVIALIWGSK